MGAFMDQKKRSSSGGDEEGDLPIPLLPPHLKPQPRDAFHLAYIVYFILDAGFLLPWNAFITAVDYFSYLYPSTPVDRVFAISYMASCLVFLVLIIGWAHRSSAHARINAGLALFAFSLLIPPVVDAAYVQGRTRVYSGYHLIVATVVLSRIVDALVQGGVIDTAGEMPEIYMQAVFSGTDATEGMKHIKNIRVPTSSGDSGWWLMADGRWLMAAIANDGG